MRQKRYLFVIVFLIFFSFLFFISPILAKNAPDQNHSSLNVSSSVPADGQTTAIVTITLHDSSDNPVIGDVTTLSDPNNSGAIITTISATTDGSGHALFSIKSTNIRTDSLNVTDTTTNTTFSNLGQITFTTPSSTPSCHDSTPGSAPLLKSAIGNGSNQIKLTWIDAANPVTNYLVSYGLSSGQYVYGNPNVGGQGTTSYTVGSLSPATKYYFVIQAINGCTPGSFSNEVSSTTTTAGGTIYNTPAPTRMPTIVKPSIINNQKNILPTNIPNQVVITQIDTPTPSPEIKPTTVPLPTQIPKAGISKAKLLFFAISTLVMTAVGAFIYRVFKKDLKKTTNTSVENKF